MIVHKMAATQVGGKKNIKNKLNVIVILKLINFEFFD